MFVFTETWLNDNIPDSAIQLNRLTCYRSDRDTTLSGKSRGGGLCVYINKEWCNNTAVLSKHCSSLVEFMFVKCRPFYLPREFTAIVIVAVYIPPCANAKDALRELYSAISEQQTNNPKGFFIIAGDFNHANLKTVLPKFYQHVNFATRGNNTLDFVYTTVKNAYKAVPRPHLGYSDHISVMLIPAYRPLLKLAKPVQKLITIWPENATSTLQDCFQCTDWNMFKEAATYNNHTDLQEYTETVTAYIKTCMDDVTVTKTITTRANQKLWMTAEVRGLLKKPEMKHSDQETKQPSKPQEPICPVASKMQNGHMLKKSIITSWTAETHGACGKPFRPSLTTSPRHRSVMMIHPSPIHSTTFIHGLKCRTTHLHKNCPHLPTTRRSVCLQPT